MSVRVCITQPETYPWLGYVDKLARSDVLVHLDTTLFRTRKFDNRNRIRTRDGSAWLTIPVESKGKRGQRIQDAIIDNSTDWRTVHLRTLDHVYMRSPWYPHFRPVFEATLRQPWHSVAAFNIHVIHQLAASLGFSPLFVRASELAAEGKGSEMLAAIAQQVGATHYLSGVHGRDYLEEAAFHKRGIDVEYQEFHHPIYPQLHEPFLPAMSSLDALFMVGPGVRTLLLGEDVPRLAQVF
jgi:hypothetical protein